VHPTRIIEIVDKYQGQEGDLIAMLEDIQSRYNYLPADALRIIAKKTGRSLSDIYSVATFYKGFSLKPRGRHLVSVCMGTACHVRRAGRVLDEVERKLDVQKGETTRDEEFTLEEVKCVGACALGPIVIVDGEYFANVQSREVGGILRKVRRSLKGRPLTGEERIFQVNVACPRCNRSLMDEEKLIDGKPSVYVVVAANGEHSWLRMSSVYGSYNIESEHPIADETVVHFFCPSCHAELRTSLNCTRCDAPMVPLLVKGGGVIQFCSRRGCKEHMLHMTPDNVE
jgi:NADH-quinone oxidoreductase subunit E